MSGCVVRTYEPVYYDTPVPGSRYQYYGPPSPYGNQPPGYRYYR